LREFSESFLQLGCGFNLAKVSLRLINYPLDDFIIGGFAEETKEIINSSAERELNHDDVHGTFLVSRVEVMDGFEMLCARQKKTSETKARVRKLCDQNQCDGIPNDRLCKRSSSQSQV